MTHDDDSRPSVVLTGVGGRFGRALARLLHRQMHVIGLDRRPFPDRPADVEHHELDLRSTRVREVFRRPGIQALIHLGVLHDRRSNAEENHAANLVIIQRLLEYAEEMRLPKLLVLSSANVYGPRPENPQLLNEDSPLLAAGRFNEIRDLVELDMTAQSLFWRSPQTETVILRPSHILGTVRNAPSNYLRLAPVPTLLGFDPMIQVVHQDDVLAALLLALRPGVRGIFNLGGPAPVPLSRALALLGRTQLPLPHAAARFAVDRMFRWRFTSFPAPELDFIRYVCMVDDSRARQALGYAPRHDLMATLTAVDDERWPD